MFSFRQTHALRIFIDSFTQTEKQNYPTCHEDEIVSFRTWAFNGFKDHFEV